MDNKTRYFLVGLVVLTSLLILIFGVFFLNDKDPREQMSEYHLLFNQVSTLTDGDPVKVNGVKMGRVEGMVLHGHQVRVSVQVQAEVNIPKDSEVKVQNIGIMGERQVGILLGRSQEFYSPGDTLTGGFDAGISEVMGYAGEVMDSAKVLMEILREVVDSTVARPEFRDGFNRIVTKAEQLEDRLNTLLDDTDPMLRSSLVSLNQAARKVNEMIDENRQPVGDLVSNATSISTDAQAMMVTTDSLLNRMMVLTDKLQSRDNTMGILLNDDQLHRELNSTVQSADSLLQVIIGHGLDVNIDFF